MMDPTGFILFILITFFMCAAAFIVKKNVANSYLGNKNDDLAQKAQQIQNRQHGQNNASPYRTNSNMTPDYERNYDNELRRKEMMQRRGQRQ